MSKVVLSLTTIPSRLRDTGSTGIKSCIDSITNQDCQDYEIHFNIPLVNKKTGEEYLIPEWLENYPCDHLKIFRPEEDYGSVTKIVPTLKRETDPETIIITCDDDLVYHHSMVSEQVKNQSEFEGCAVGYDGIMLRTPIFNDQRDYFCTSMRIKGEVKALQQYKSVSFRRKYFEDDFFTNFIDKSWADDIIISAYMGLRGIGRMVTYHDSDEKFSTLDECMSRGGVTTFPVLRHTNHETIEGCNLWRDEQVSDDEHGILWALIDKEIAE